MVRAALAPAEQTKPAASQSASEAEILATNAADPHDVLLFLTWEAELDLAADDPAESAVWLFHYSAAAELYRARELLAVLYGAVANAERKARAAVKLPPQIVDQLWAQARGGLVLGVLKHVSCPLLLNVQARLLSALEPTPLRRSADIRRVSLDAQALWVCVGASLLAAPSAALPPWAELRTPLLPP